MKNPVLFWLLSCLVVLVCCHDRNRPIEHSRARPSVPPFRFVYYDYGGPPELYVSKAQAVVLKKYGLSYQGFGCVVTDSLIRAVHQHNDSLFALLQSAFPGLGEDRLRQEILTCSTTRPIGGNARHR